MAEYRTHMKIIGDILSTTKDDLQDGNGASVTYLIRKANVSHSRIFKNFNNSGVARTARTGGESRLKQIQD